MIYADNAATTQLDADVLEAMKPFLTSEYGNASQPYSFARAPKKALKKARETIAGCIGALPEEVFFTSCGTESDNWALKGTLTTERDTQVVTSQIEHHAILNSCRTLERLGYSVAYLPVTDKGIVTPGALQDALQKKTRLVSVMLVNNEIGTVEPIAELAQLAHAHGALFHTDAVQAVGHIPVNVNDLQVDMLSSSAHKYNGPKGIGFLYIRKGTQIYSFMDGGAQEYGYRAGTENVASIIGMAAALKKNVDHMAEHTLNLHAMEQAFFQVLNQSGLDYIRNGAAQRAPGNISLSIKGAEGEMLLHRMDLKGICISTGSACDSVNTQLSHVIKAIKVPEAYAKGTIRISLGVHNTVEEAVKIAEALVGIVHQ